MSEKLPKTVYIKENNDAYWYPYKYLGTTEYLKTEECCESCQKKLSKLNPKP